MLRLNIWVVRLAWLSGILGIAGAFAIIFSLAGESRNYSTPGFSSQPIVKKQIPNDIPQEISSPKVTRVYKTDEKVKPVAIPQPVITPKKEVTIAPVKVPETITKAEEKKIEPVKVEKVNQQVKPAEIPKAPISVEKAVEEKKPVNEEEKIFDQQELEQLVSQIKQAKQSLGIWSNCIKISKTRSGNNRRATAQIEMYLRNQSFSIAGREETNQKIKGVQITENGDCIKLLIGNF